ncbi:MAG: hypothetical protein SOV58_04785 [Candidatus Enteromonas sp.]|nr:hypothetical protein [Candidatus Enteromonas sp.]
MSHRIRRIALSLVFGLGLLRFASVQETPVSLSGVESTTITMSQLSNYLSKQDAHYPISDDFIKTHQQASGGYIQYAKQCGKTVDKEQCEPDQKWHFFSSWLYRSIDDGTLTWQESGKGRTYSGFLCPELLLWLFEACGGDSTAVEAAKEVAITGKDAGTPLATIAKNMRELVPWDNLEANILAGISPDDPYHVTPAVDKDNFLITGLSYDGYQPGDTVKFDLALLSPLKKVSALSYNDVALEVNEEGHYSFPMPSSDVTLSVTLVDVDAPEPEPDPTSNMTLLADLDFPVADQRGVTRYTTSFTCSNNGIGFTVSGANNNSNKWSYVAMGTKSTSNTASIVNSTPLPNALSAIKLDLSAYRPDAVESATLYLDESSDFSSPTSLDLTSLIPAFSAPGEVTILVPQESWMKGGYAKLEWKTNDSVASNGYIHLDRVRYFSPSLGTLASLQVEDGPMEMTAGTPFAFSSKTRAVYDSGSRVLLAQGLTFSLNGTPIQNGDLIPADAAGENVPLIVSYSESGINVSQTLLLTIAPPSGVDEVVSGTLIGASPIEAFSGSLLQDAADLSSYQFSFSRTSGNVETPSIGLSSSDVHLGIYDSSTPTEEGTPIDGSYELTLQDHGKYLVGFYEGVRAEGSVAISIIKWRSVLQDIENETVEYDFSSSDKNSNSEMKESVFHGYRLDSTVLLSSTQISKVYNAKGDTDGYLKLSTASLAGFIRLTVDPGLSIDSISVTAKYYSPSESSFSINGKSFDATETFSTFTVSKANGDYPSTNEFALLPAKRLFVQSFSFTVSGSQDIGKQSDALALESFIDQYLHMDDYGENLGYCADQEHGYYQKAKTAFDSLSETQKKLFASNSAYQSECARLSAWAKANGESFLGGMFLSQKNAPSFFASNKESLSLALFAGLGISSLLGCFFLRRKAKRQTEVNSN